MCCVNNALQSVAGTKVYEQTFYLGTGTIAKNQYVSRTKTTLYSWQPNYLDIYDRYLPFLDQIQ